MKIYLSLLFLVLTGCSQSPSQNLKASGQNASGAAVNSASAVSHGAAASGQIASGAVAVPFKAVGAVGSLSNKAGDGLLNASGMNNKLEVSDDAVSAGAPPSAE